MQTKDVYYNMLVPFALMFTMHLCAGGMTTGLTSPLLYEWIEESFQGESYLKRPNFFDTNTGKKTYIQGCFKTLLGYV